MPRVKRILCAVDFSPATAAVAHWAVAFAQGLGAEVIVLYVAPELGRYASFQVQTGIISDFVAQIMGGAKSNMDHCLAEHFAGVPARGVVAMGYAAEEIVTAAREQEADFIILGTHGRKGIDRIVFGSVAEKVLKASPVPVFTVRPYGVPSPGASALRSQP